MLAPAQTDRRGVFVIIFVAVFAGSLLWKIVTPYDDDDLRSWIGMFLTELLLAVVLLFGWKHWPRKDEPPPA